MYMMYRLCYSITSLYLFCFCWLMVDLRLLFIAWVDVLPQFLQQTNTIEILVELCNRIWHYIIYKVRFTYSLVVVFENGIAASEDAVVQEKTTNDRGSEERGRTTSNCPGNFLKNHFSLFFPELVCDWKWNHWAAERLLTVSEKSVCSMWSCLMVQHDSW